MITDKSRSEHAFILCISLGILSLNPRASASQTGGAKISSINLTWKILGKQILQICLDLQKQKLRRSGEVEFWDLAGLHGGSAV